ncbi:ABC transporter substrate-binding protein [Endozoicomonadaceae bacterium StTr2]
MKRVVIFCSILWLMICNSFAGETHLQRCNGAIISSLHPHFFGGEPDACVIYDLFEGLVTQTPEGTVTEGLAESYGPYQGNLNIWHFKLRQGLKWSDGTSLTASDFVDSFKRLAALGQTEQKTYACYLAVAGIKNASAILYQGGNPDELGISAIDEHTVVIELDSSTPAIECIFPDLLAFPAFLPVPKHMRESGTPVFNLVELETEKQNKLVCCGPYKLESVLKVGVHSVPCITLQKNPHYHASEAINITHVSWHGTANLAHEKELFERKQLHITTGLPASDLATADRQTLKAIKMLATGILQPFPKNFKMPEHQDLLQAISAAIDRQKIITDLSLQELWEPATSFIPDMDGFTPFRSETQTVSDQFIQKASTHWLEKNSSVKTLILLCPEREDPAGILPKIISQLNQRFEKSRSELRFKASSLPWDQFLTSASTAHLLGWGWLAAYNEPSAFIFPLLPRSKMLGQFEIAGLEALFTSARSQTGLSERDGIYQSAAKLISDACPVVPLFKGPRFRLVSPDIKNYPLSNPQGWAFTKWLSI